MQSTHSCGLWPARGVWASKLALLLLMLASLWPHSSLAQSSTPPTIHVPYSGTTPDPAKGAIFWFGILNQASNSANVRMSHADDSLVVMLHIFDRLVIYDQADSVGRDLTQWDAVSLYLDNQSDLNAPLGAGSYRFDAELSHWQLRTNYQAAWRRQGDAWQRAETPFASASGFRGAPNDTLDDRGWTARFQIPFAALGLSSAPSQDTQWRMALVLHDRDEITGAPLPSQLWPQAAGLDQPATWGRVAFGAPTYNATGVTAVQTLSLRHGVNQLVAQDGAVGGHSLCGAQFSPNFFNGWGDANYAGLTQVNIQNQWDVADWPCFSRYYVTFPLTALPSTAKIVSATLTMQMFGNAGYAEGDAKPSMFQVARVAEEWDERTLTWNNGPTVLENSSWTTVNPMQAGDPAAKPVNFDVSRAAADAVAAGQPLRLVLYSSDGDYHSGKYFWSADAGESLRPLLTIKWGSQGYSISATPRQLVLDGDTTADVELAVAAVNSGETVTLSVGPSSPAGLEISLEPKTIAAPGGKAKLIVSDRTSQNSQQAAVYTVPIRATNGTTEQTATLTVFVNGHELFLPEIVR